MDVEDAYEVIERIIVNGFLTAEMRAVGSYIVMKNMTEHEASTMDLFRDPKSIEDDLACKLSLCTFSVDGMNLMASRAEVMPAIMDFWKHAPVSLVSSANIAITGISERYYEVLKFLEGFCYTDRSRYMWRVYKEGCLINVPGALSAGMSAVQENWAMVNRELDSEEEYHKDFNLSLMVASSFNAKGAKVIARNYETNHTEIEDLRKEIAKWGYDRKRVEEEKKQAEWTAPVRSREDLVRELYRQMRGEKDKHDLFIEKWMQRQRDRAEEAKKRALERSKAWQAKSRSADMNLDSEESRRATPEEIAKLSKAPSSYASKYMSAYEGFGSDDRFLKKIGARVIGEESPVRE